MLSNDQPDLWFFNGRHHRPPCQERRGGLRWLYGEAPLVSRHLPTQPLSEVQPGPIMPVISKLPRWVWAGAWALAFVAGIINTVGLLGFEHQAVTHLTGTTSMLAAALASLDASTSLHLAVVIGAFVMGAVISGFLIQDSTLQLGRRYGVALLLESVLLCIAVPLLNRNSMLGLYSASCACGLQNAMVSAYSGAVVRTTHLSGMFTDLGIFFGHFLRGLPVDARRLRLCVIVISGFGIGGIVGASAFHHLGYSTLFIPAGLTATTALSYGIYRIRKRGTKRASPGRGKIENGG